MTVKELIEMLATQDPNAEVRMLGQPRYPTAHAVAGVASDAAVLAVEIEEGMLGDVPPNPPQAVVFLVEGESIGYGPRAAWIAAKPRR